MLFASDVFALLSIALIADALIGEPDALWRRVPHPVVLVGRLISAIETRANRPDLSEGRRRAAGIGLVVVLVIGLGALGFALQWLLNGLPAGPILVALLASVFIAQNSLVQHVGAVATNLRNGIEPGRAAVAQIVGRDPDVLDEPAIARAAIESNAENFSDGVVAPAFWFAVAGLPGLIAYKALNTADSMIGHRSERYRAFGWAAARLDDVANYLPARIAGLLIVVASPFGGGSFSGALMAMIRDARRLASPNAGYPEAAMAGSLALALAGPRHYAGGITEGEWINEAGTAGATPADIERSVRVVWGAWSLMLVATLAIAVVNL